MSVELIIVQSCVITVLERSVVYTLGAADKSCRASSISSRKNGALSNLICLG
jgi:hypothetical protein